MAFATDATLPIDAEGADASIFEPAPGNIREVLRLRNTTIHDAWLKVYRREIKNLIDTDTFRLAAASPGTSCTPIMDLNKVKLCSDGSLD
jgi:hypothetical protein